MATALFGLFSRPCRPGGPRTPAGPKTADLQAHNHMLLTQIQWQQPFSASFRALVGPGVHGRPRDHRRRLRLAETVP